MRSILLIVILAVVAIIAAIGTGFVNINQTRGAKAPDVAAGRDGVSASGGQTPAFDIETGSVEVGTKPTNIVVPTPRIEVNPAGNAAAEQAGNNVGATP